MRYIKIKNKGLMQPQALTLMGASTKVNDESKIGQFGSGNKYALAYLLRNDYKVKIFSGASEIKITTQREHFRENIFEVVYINGEKTSITTQMGKDWQFWQSIREIYCNALDEGEAIMEFVSMIEPQPNETHFYIDNKQEAGDFVRDFDLYFSNSAKILFSCEDGAILEKSGTEANLYRKGVRCFNTDKKSHYDYDFSDIDIDESRLVKYHWEVDSYIWKLVIQCPDEEIIKNIISNCNDEYLEGRCSDLDYLNTSKMSDAFKKVISEMEIAPNSYKELIDEDKKATTILIPSSLYNKTSKYISNREEKTDFEVLPSGTLIKELENTPEFTAELAFRIKKISLFFPEVKDLKTEIKLCRFDKQYIVSHCDISKNKVYISERIISNPTKFEVHLFKNLFRIENPDYEIEHIIEYFLAKI
jgi:hypothetical protein